jgi:AmmeMemoRadiSam system protein B/AmmeMemoRadiSam system protein A
MKPMQALKFAAVSTLIVFVVLSACGNSKPSDIRPAAVSGSFYPSNPQKLKLAVQKFLGDSPEISMEKPIALVVPHAGYIYSGQICADAYRQIMGHSYDVVVVLGTNHTTAGFSGISLGEYDFYRTPLGDIPIDETVVSALLNENSDCVRSRTVHIGEHSIEIQLPFIQTLLPNARIVPAIICPPDYEMCLRFGRTLAKVLENRRALIVISSDLSHYPNYDDAVRVDSLTLKTIADLDLSRISSLMRNLDAPGLDTRACGEAGILAGIAAAKSLGATRAVVASYANSGDALIGDKSRVVGYGAVILSSGNSPNDTTALNRSMVPSKAEPLQDSEKKILLQFARESVLRYLTTQTLPLPRNFPSRMKYPQGAFVTLKKGGDLRGCIGHLMPDSELGLTVGAMALQAAFNDRRFAPVKLDELENLEIEISVLTPMTPISSPEEIVVGRDGVLLSKSGTSAVFLPQVAEENNWDRTEMLDNLCKKGGLPADCWEKEAQFQVFQADVFSEHQFR